MSRLTFVLVSINLLWAVMNLVVFAVWLNPINLGVVVLNLATAAFCYWILETQI